MRKTRTASRVACRSGARSAFATAVLAALGTAVAATAVVAGAAVAQAAPSADPSCRLDPAHHDIKHVIHLQFDNVHFTRDNPNVPSDLEQMPNLLNFLTGNGTLDANHHTPLIAHTGTDILTSLTGLYGNRMGQPISNSYRYFSPDGTSHTGVSFAYWTDGVFDPANASPTDTAPTMVTPEGKVAPAPWVAYTKAGCDVGSAAAANTILENTGPDVPKVFGPGSPETQEAQTNPALAATDFVGIGVHCAQGSAVCAKGNAKPDVLPDEPGGYAGFQGLFGAKYVDPVIAGGPAVSTVDGSAPITDAGGNPGFPGFDGMSAANTLGYIAQMQEAGIPVTYGYISDAHDKHTPPTHAYGPGEAGYEAALKSYDNAFGAFFARLGRDGITKNNTLFVVTSDENDHFVGGAPSPANCDGVTVPCTYSTIGEVNGNLTGLLATQQGVTTPFAVHSDSAPNFYLTGNPARDATVTRTFEQATAALTTTNPISGQNQKIFNYFADPVEMKLLHMVTGDPARTPTFTGFANPDYFLFAGAPNCNSPCVTVQPGFAWNHGDFSPDINVTWLGIVGPGVKHLGVTRSVWSDHTDIRPTMLTLLGLSDSYRSDGRALTELIDENRLPVGLRGHRDTLTALEQVYKQLNACVGEFGTNTLIASTKGITGTDAQYTQTMNTLTTLGQLRDVVADRIAAQLDSATFHNGRINEPEARLDIALAEGLIGYSALLAR